MTKVCKFDAQTCGLGLNGDGEASGETGVSVLVEPLLEVQVVFKWVELKASLMLP